MENLDILRFFKNELEQNTASLNKLLYQAVLAGNVFFVQQLLRLGAQIVHSTKEGHNCLHLATKQGYFAILNI